MERKIAEILKSLHITPNLIGYEYLKSAISLALYESSYIRNITKALYPDVAKQFGTLPHRVERAIRHAIASGLADAPYEAVHEIFGTYYAAAGRITNSHFIAGVVEYIRLDDSPHPQTIGTKLSIQPRIVKQDKYEVGDKVLIVDRWTPYCYAVSEMNKWLGKVMTIRKVIREKNAYRMVEDKDDGGWIWFSTAIVGKVIDNV